MRLSIGSGKTEWKRAATTASRLDTEQDNDAQTRFATTFKKSNVPPLSRGYILGSGEDSMQLLDLMELCTILSDLVNTVTAAGLLNAVRHNLVLPVQVNAAEAKAKTVNCERQLQALVDKKKVIITETSIRSDLYLEDAGGIDCLPTATIFEELARMGAKTTAWNEFSSTMASAIISLSTNQKFNLSKYIFDAMLGDMSYHKKIYVNPSHTKKIFANMKREGKDFSGKVTPLFATMMVQANQEEGVDSGIPTTSQQTPTAQAQEITNLKLRVKKLEKKAGLRTHKFKRLYKGRSIEDIDKDAKVSLVDETQGRSDDAKMFDTDTLIGNEVFVENDMIGKDQDDKGKVKMDEPEVPLNKKDQIDLDEEMARNLEAQIQVELIEEERLARKKEEEANIALIESWDNTQAMMEADFELAQRLQAEEQGEITIKERSRLFVELMNKEINTL
ncbi:hypothetical protein Tco_0980368, partial [Tanacetum coccineum]